LHFRVKKYSILEARLITTKGTINKNDKKKKKKTFWRNTKECGNLKLGKFLSKWSKKKTKWKIRGKFGVTGQKIQNPK
jgi:hypothetical protein